MPLSVLAIQPCQAPRSKEHSRTSASALKHLRFPCPGLDSQLHAQARNISQLQTSTPLTTRQSSEYERWAWTVRQREQNQESAPGPTLSGHWHKPRDKLKWITWLMVAAQPRTWIMGVTSPNSSSAGLGHVAQTLQGSAGFWLRDAGKFGYL